ncbi:MAG: LysR family transcriptional regulator [Pseudomonadota bacterium]
MSRFDEIAVFVRTVEAGSFTAAATQLGIGKSIVSRRIRELEQRLGAQLLVRSTRTQHLTDEGQALYERATELLAAWQDMESLGRVEDSPLAGRIRVSVPLSFGLARFGPALSSFCELHPDVHLDVQFSDRKVDLIAEGFDVALRIADLPDSTLKARKLETITHTAVASPVFLLQNGTPTRPADLTLMPELRFGLRERKRWPYVDTDGTVGEIELQARLSADNGEFLCDAACRGLGVVLLPRFIVDQAIERGDLVELLPDVDWYTLELFAVYPATRHLPQRVRALIDHLVDCCGGSEAG